MDTLRNFLLVSLVVLLAVILYKRLLKKMGANKAKLKYTNFISIDSGAEKVNIKIEVPEAEQVTLSVYDKTDKLLDTVNEGQVEAGEHEFSWTKPENEGGQFYCLLKTRNQQATRYFS
ncbi:FlgD immunoglobulin-like domain containing protein [Halocola ammonii]